MDAFIDSLVLTSMKIVKVLSVCSTVATSLVVISGILLLYTKREITNKISFRLALFVAFYEFMFHVANVVNTNELNYSLDPTIACRLTHSISNFSKLMSVFTTTTIAYNLDMILIRQRSEVKRAQFWYVPFTITIALVITLACTIYSIATEVCWLANLSASPNAWWIQWLSIFLWMFLGLSYSLYVVIRVIRLLRQHQTDMHTTMEKSGQVMSERLRRVSFRIIMYAVVPILTFFPSILSFTIQSIGYSVPRQFYVQYLSLLDAVVWVIAELLTSSTGLLTTLVYVFDPAVTAALADFSGYIRDRSKPKRGHNKNTSGWPMSRFFRREEQPYTQQTSSSWQENTDSATHIVMIEPDLADVSSNFDAFKLL